MTNHVLSPPYVSGTVLGMEESEPEKHSARMERVHCLARETDVEKISTIWGY